MYYRSWKYWHAAKNHYFALGIVVAYDIYRECCVEAYGEFGLEKAPKLLSFDEFREQLSDQGLKYNPKYREYPGDERMRANTKWEKKKRTNSGLSANKRKRKDGVTTAVVTPAQFKEAKRTESSRLCGDLTKIMKHLNSIEECSARICGWCGDTCLYRCGICGVAAHNNAKKGNFVGRDCFMLLHNDATYGLGWQDKHALFGGNRQEVRKVWTPPTEELKQQHAKHIADIQKKMPYRLRSSAADNGNI